MLLTRNGYLSLEEIPENIMAQNPALLFYPLIVSAKKLIVLHLRDFSSWGQSDLDDTLDKIIKENPDYLVIDLKDSAGGSTNNVIYLSYALNINKPFNTSINYIDLKSAEHQSRQLDWNWVISDIHLKNIWRGPVLLRTNAICGSACDQFARWFQLNRRGSMIGTPTAGRAAEPAPFILNHSKILIMIPFHDERIVGDPYPIEEYPTVPGTICEDDLTTCLLQFLSKPIQ
jgi:hypothetical protein